MEVNNTNLRLNQTSLFSEEKEEKEEKEVTSKTLLDLPVEVIHCVLDFLDSKSILNFLSTSNGLLNTFSNQRQFVLLNRKGSRFKIPTEIQAILDKQSGYSNAELRILKCFQILDTCREIGLNCPRLWQEMDEDKLIEKIAEENKMERGIYVNHLDAGIVLIKRIDLIENLTNLIQLNIENIEILNFPNIEKLVQLIYLRFNYVRVLFRETSKEFLSSLMKLDNLETLSLYHIGLENFLEKFSFPKLKKLYLGHNKLKTISSYIGNLTELKELSLNNNELQTIPKEIKNCKSLEWCNISYNQLRFLPPELGQCRNLTHLDLGDNKLRTLPKELSKLNLDSISISKNPIESLPMQFSQYFLGKKGVHRIDTIPPFTKIKFDLHNNAKMLGFCICLLICGYFLINTLEQTQEEFSDL